jgi:putative DNA primase/helicase
METKTMSALDQVFGTVEPPALIPKSHRRKPAVVAVDPPKPVEPLPARFDLLTPQQVQLRPRLPWAVLHAVPLWGLMSIYGPSGCGKSFLTIDLAAALGEGRDWFDHRVRKACRVVYLALEGAEGIRQRIEAWEKFHSRQFPVNVRFVFDAFRINDRNNVLHLAAAIDEAGGADVVIIDTLNRAAPDMDENSSRDMGMSLEGGKELQSMIGGVVVYVSHTGKDATRGLRGHSSLFAALDAAIEVTRTADNREWSIAKSKDGSDGQVHRFHLEVVDLGEDDDGEPITSCVVRHDDTPLTMRPKLPQGKNQKIVYDALVPLFKASNCFGKAGAPPIRPCITFEEAINGSRDRIPTDPKRRTERAQQAITGLVASGVLGANEGWLWLI